jgi:hypothetical protein
VPDGLFQQPARIILDRGMQEGAASEKREQMNSDASLQMTWLSKCLLGFRNVNGFQSDLPLWGIRSRVCCEKD